MNAFAAGVRTLFNDPNGSISGVYTLPGGQAVPVRVLRVVSTDAVAGAIVQSGNQAAQVRAELLASEVPSRPAKGALLTFDGKSYRLASAADPTRNGLTWTMTLGTV